ncbi:hypothetical protein FOA43_002041 [Brettanomyces nanus]|uniref:Cyclin-like domain-containing protein n=1 Tax=Eeniella nana TaxID=13502 RepID=A0A875S173_EENNA|nr:uncharacterized protein FOA43_002041 [Brettanomyces nanus]QPG74708.1 hypothetical protein FOA43_002041 [Brettanomyces nanus]
MSEAEVLDVFLNSPVTQDMIHHLVNVTLQILPCESSKTITQQLPSPPNSPPVFKTKSLPSLMTFISKLVRYTNVYTGTLMATIVYMNRLKSRLPQDAQGVACTRHRIFLACLIIASKYFNDSSPKNKHWSRYTDGLFRKEDVNLMERQLLMLLDWDLKVETDELTAVWKRFLDPIRLDLRRQSRMRNSLARGTLVNSTQTISMPKQRAKDTHATVSRRSSFSSTFSNTEETHSRNSSVSSISSNGSSYSSGKYVKNANYCHSVGCGGPVLMSNYLDTCAIREQQQLNDLMRQYCSYV